MRRETLICAALLVITLLAFWPAGHLGFILLDDYQYVVENTNIQGGITFESIHWAFTTMHASNWHPVTWLSHMLDYQWFGPDASGHHWINLGFHIANTLLLFFGLREMTKTVWRSALVAALFALHPMHLQSVAWISERKDVLSAFFFLLTLWAYARYVQKQASGVWCLASGDYWLALVFFALGLMSKPMLVTVPVILLLLDFWPLGRWRPVVAQVKTRPFILPPATGNLERLIVEKLPFWGLSLASSIVTVWAQDQGGAIMPADRLSWYRRIVDALVFYAAYLGKIFWPQNLAIFYPYPHLQPSKFIGSALLLIVLSVFCARRMRSQPHLLAGWCWFVVMLLPVIGLVQAGMQSIADRYTYLPSIGLFIMVAWGMAGLAARSRSWRTGMVLGAMALLLTCLLDTRVQLRYWRDDVMLFGRAVEVSGDNIMSNYYLGDAYWESGNLDKAARNFRVALQLEPDFEQARDQLGRVLLRQKKFADAEAQFDEILGSNPYNATAHKHLGDTFAAQGRYAEAEAEYSTVLQLKPGDEATRQVLTVATLKAGSDNALTNLYHSLKNLPTPEVHLQIAILRATRGEFQDAVDHYLEALRLKPDSPDVLNNLAWLLATCPDAQVRNGAQAVKDAERACELTRYQMTPLVGTLAAAYAEAGQFDEAMATAKKACTLASESGEQDLLKRNQELLALYRAHQPYHEDAEKPAPAVP